VAERIRQYESLRRQALEAEPQETSHPASWERAFLECRGLVAWLEHAADMPPDRVVSIKEQLSKRQEREVPPRDVILTLDSLVVGDRQEVQHG
jgi:uncharacterized protein YfaQ (DUF2300 family)